MQLFISFNPTPHSGGQNQNLEKSLKLKKKMETIIYRAPQNINLGDHVFESNHYGDRKHTVIFCDGVRIATKLIWGDNEKIITLWEHKKYQTNYHLSDWSVECENESERPFKLKKIDHSELHKCCWVSEPVSKPDNEALRSAVEQMRESANAYIGLARGFAESIRNA